MRIRKNTKLSSMLLATTGYVGERPETYVCLLNQSPWDVIPVGYSGDDNELTNLLDSYCFLLPPPSSSSPLRIHNKFNGEEDSFNGINVSLGNSNGVTERLENLVTIVRSPEVKEPMKAKTDDAVVSMPPVPPPKRGRPRGTGKKTAATTVTTTAANPYEFYYYSGFGPRWGRKRGSSGSDGDCGRENNNKSQKSSDDGGSDKTAAFGDGGGGSSSFDGFEFMEEDFDDDDDDNVVNQEEDDDSDHEMMKKKKKKKKKMMVVTKRKPVKERSLKSLM